jgi:RNA polymerase sigma-70 factor, ECF subfamily
LNLATSRWRRLRTAEKFARAQRESTVPGPEPDRVMLAAALRQLPDRQRRAIVLHYLAGMTGREIVASEGVSDTTVRVWLHRGRNALAVLLADPQQALAPEVGHV